MAQPIIPPNPLVPNTTDLGMAGVGDADELILGLAVMGVEETAAMVY